MGGNLKQYFSLLIALSLLAVIILVRKPIDNFYTRMDSSVAEYQQAVSRSRVMLSGLLRNLSDEPVLKSSLNTKRYNSISHFLKGSLRIGEIETLAILNINGPSVYATISPPVLATSKFPKESGFFWTRNKSNNPVLGLVLNLHGTTSRIVGYVPLDPKWLSVNNLEYLKRG